MSKVFGIGLGRTGTTSLHKALSILGYKSIHLPRSLEEIKNHEASDDLTVSCRYKELDLSYPGSKFILTVRNYDSWMVSCIWHYRHHWGIDRWPEPAKGFVMDAEQRIYGAAAGRKIEPVDIMDGAIRHLQGVMLHFRDRSQDLLVINISAGEGWERLCPFLGKANPNVPFPHANKRTS